MANVAQTILEQLGGNRFIAMTGAKQLSSVDTPRIKSLIFGIGRGAKNGINKINVTLQDNDLYVVAFYKIRGMRAETVGIVENVYADKLAAVFTEHTGFDTRL